MRLQIACEESRNRNRLWLRLDGRLDTRIVLAHAGVKEALESGVGHAGQRTQAAVGRFVRAIVWIALSL